MLVVQVDVKEPHHALSQLMRVAILTEMTLMLAWSHEEAASILETYKLFENKPPDMIMEQKGPSPHEKMIEALTSIKSINKTDAVTLLGTFKTLADILRAEPEDLALCPGLGPNKAKKLYKVLHEPFKRQVSSSQVELKIFFNRANWLKAQKWSSPAKLTRLKWFGSSLA